MKSRQEHQTEMSDHFKNTAEAARAQDQEYLECQYEDVLVHRNGALVDHGQDLNYLIAWEFVNFARAKSPGDVGYLSLIRLQEPSRVRSNF